MSSFAPFDDARTLLLAANLVPASHIHWPNEPFREPAGDPPALWLMVESIGTLLDPIEMGGGAWQESGTVFVHIMTPINAGSDAARALAKSIANVFRGLPARNVVYRGASIGDGLHTDPAGMWWALTVSVDWVYQDIG